MKIKTGKIEILLCQKDIEKIILDFFKNQGHSVKKCNLNRTTGYGPMESDGSYITGVVN